MAQKPRKSASSVASLMWHHHDHNVPWRIWIQGCHLGRIIDSHEYQEGETDSWLMSQPAHTYFQSNSFMTHYPSSEMCLQVGHAVLALSERWAWSLCLFWLDVLPTHLHVHSATCPAVMVWLQRSLFLWSIPSKTVKVFGLTNVLTKLIIEIDS